jgi:AraC-like DNA-binding protein
VILLETNHINRERQTQYYNLKVQEAANVLDLQFMDADMISANINSSNIIKRYSTDKGSVGSTTDFDVTSEMKSFMTSSRNLNIYDTILFLNNSDKAFSSVQTYSLDKTYGNYDQMGSQKIMTISLNQEYLFNNAATVFQKQWIVYRKNYNSMINKGCVCILFDKNSIQNSVKDIIGDDTGISFYFNDEVICSDGTIQNAETFQAKSFTDNSITYKLIVDSANLKGSGNLFMSVAIGVAILLTALFIILALGMSNEYYQPFGNIEQMIGGSIVGKGQDELKNIVSGIQKLIGERNGYREKMLTIKPYAQQGMFHGMLSGNIEPDKLDVFLKDEYLVLQKPYFIVSIVNIAYVGKGTLDKQQCKRIRDIMIEMAKEYYTEDLNITFYNKDLWNIFMIINSNTNERLEQIFYELYTRIVRRTDREDYVITIGVDQVREELSGLSEACSNAIKTLGTMMVGGRGAVYFYEKETKADKQKYFFPKDALVRLTKALKERNLENVRKFLDEIYETNIKKYDMSPGTMQLLVDEVHITTIKALKNVDALNTIDFSIEKIKTVATLEEVLDYYYAVYEAICRKLGEIAIPSKEIGVLDKEIIECMDEQYKNPEMSLQYLSEKFGVSNKYISIVSKKYLGMTYLQYLQTRRIEYAVSLLTSATYSLEQIAGMCGYTNMLTFRRNFKAVKGVNPSEFAEDGAINEVE